MSTSFRDHKLSDAEIAWLTAVYQDSEFEPKVARIRLRGKLPKGFKPREIDSRFLLDGKRLTLLGIARIDPDSLLLRNLERIILKIRDSILEEPGIETFTAEALAPALGLEREEVEKALEYLSGFGGFFSSASKPNNAGGYSSIGLAGDNAYDAYLEFENLELLMQEYYQSREKSAGGSDASTILGSGASSYIQTELYSDYVPYYGQQPLLYRDIKKNAAFVLMPMDPENAELEDVYETIKRVCASFRIHAYRADEIEHQDRITDLILSEIKQCELLIADLSYERPNVYYEIGYAHAIQKRPILYRKTGTRLHFDLSVHNVPEYRNTTELGNSLQKRLEAILGRSAPSSLA